MDVFKIRFCPKLYIFFDQHLYIWDTFSTLTKKTRDHFSILRYFTIYQMLTLMLLLMKSEEAEVEVGSMKNFDRVLFVSFVFLAYGTHHIHNITKHVIT